MSNTSPGNYVPPWSVELRFIALMLAKLYPDLPPNNGSWQRVQTAERNGYVNVLEYTRKGLKGSPPEKVRMEFAFIPLEG